MKTRKQLLLQNAQDRVNAVRANESGNDTPVADAYGGLCHAFPVMVRNHGLAQTCAWIDAKAVGDKPLNQAYAILRTHIKATLQLAPNDDLSSKVAAADVHMYMYYTTLLMDAWVYYKRFAVSILDAQNAVSLEDAS